MPSYQRGYRWDESDVKRLLNDIWTSKSKDSEYNLQPIVVKPSKQEAEEEWELIDGQQRLTTLYLIFRYLKNQTSCGDGAPYSLSVRYAPGNCKLP